VIPLSFVAARISQAWELLSTPLSLWSRVDYSMFNDSAFAGTPQRSTAFLVTGLVYLVVANDRTGGVAG